MKHAIFTLVAVGAVACGAFLADTGDDQLPTSSADPDASSADGSRTDEGGSLVDGSSKIDASADAAFVQRATCGAKTCDPGIVCCVSNTNGAFCLFGDMTCNGSELSCTRDPDCAPGETCCITLQAITLGRSTSTCVKGGCPGDVICSTQDSTSDQACGTLTCTSGGKTTSYGLPAADPWGICQ